MHVTSLDGSVRERAGNSLRGSDLDLGGERTIISEEIKGDFGFRNK